MVKLAITPDSKPGFLGSNPSGGVKKLLFGSAAQMADGHWTVNPTLKETQKVRIFPLPYSALAQLVRASG